MSREGWKNSAWIDMANSVDALHTAVTTAESEGTEQDNPTITQAKQKVEQDLKALVNHPLNVKYEPSGYGALPKAAIGPAKQLHKAVTTINESPSERLTSSTALVEVERSLSSFVSSINPRHPSLMKSSSAKDDAVDTQNTKAQETIKAAVADPASAEAGEVVGGTSKEVE